MASGAKVAIDLLPTKEDTKDWSKLGIDFAVSTYKLQVEAERKRIQEQAQLHKLDRVIAFTGTIWGKQQTALRLYGGDISAFCQSLGLTLFEENNLPAESAYIDQMVQQNGIVIYERK